ncbi:hypothetical protein L2E82_12859 [Cichorium intybus]|uniref:Uncharacterized protein n=1 Tax=Cichorium intybus TaxID=13427 RepID=A0ACB9GI07_CICIN|nr:hypothetical protein L2E82_12859 [Cichorium intybus]
MKRTRRQYYTAAVERLFYWGIKRHFYAFLLSDLSAIAAKAAKQKENRTKFQLHERVFVKITKMQLTLEFGGGLELLCDSVKIHSVDVDLPAEEKKLTMKHLLAWVRSNLIKERPEMFMKGDTVRPGVLVLVNDCDWELSGQLDTTLENKDVVVFISTLHGG